MKIFISWSGDFSREVAEKLSIWIPSVIQSVDVFFSPDDIGKGENWNNVLSKELNDCNFGIVCLTPENVAAPWIHFEAGALARALNSRVSSIMLGINTSEVKGPLSRFQNTKFEQNDFFKLVQAINDASDKPLKPENLAYLFNILWRQLDSEIAPIIKKYEGTSTLSKQTDKTNDGDAIQEILSIVRKMSSNTSFDEERDINPDNFEHSHASSSNAEPSEISIVLMLTKRFKEKPLQDETKKVLDRLFSNYETTKAIQILERGDTFHYIICSYPHIVKSIVDTLSRLPDLTVSTKRRPQGILYK